MKLGTLGGKLDGNLGMKLIIAVVIVAIAAIARTFPHTANMTPFFAVTLALGAWLGRENFRWTGLLAIGGMLLSDLVIGFHWTMPFVYVGLLFGAFLGAKSAAWMTATNSYTRRGIFAALTAAGASTIFFVISNFGVWFVGDLYPMTIEGLATCFMMAIPFFGKSLTADLFFGTAFLLVAIQALAIETERNANALGGSINAR